MIQSSTLFEIVNPTMGSGYGFFVPINVRPQIVDVNNQRGYRALAGDVAGDGAGDN